MKEIHFFENKRVRSHYDSEQEIWYFSVIDIIEILTDSPRPRKYWNALKTKLITEGSELSQFMGQLKMRAEDGKMRATDVGTVEQIFRLVQSIPAPKAGKKGGTVAKNARKELEAKTGKSVVNSENFLPPKKPKQ